ncbi:MAG TPA: hypothetical protein EYH49_03925 [Aquifex aeolicus]|nr:hypothetical protein [Aquifex aeolicus]
MKPKNFGALMVGLDIVGGIIAGLLVGYFFDIATKKWLGYDTSPWGLLFFFFIGIVAGFKNAFTDMKRL